MNDQFKSEFKKLNPDEIKYIINGCAGRDVLETKFSDAWQTNNKDTVYTILYIDDENYGFWNIEWCFKKFDNGFSINGGYGSFKYRIKITPFRIDFYNADSNEFNPYSSPNRKTQVQDYLQIYINKKCPNYKQAAMDEMEKFFHKIDINYKSETKNNDDFSK